MFPQLFSSSLCSHPHIRAPEPDGNQVRLRTGENKQTILRSTQSLKCDSSSATRRRDQGSRKERPEGPSRLRTRCLQHQRRNGEGGACPPHGDSPSIRNIWKVLKEKVSPSRGVPRRTKQRQKDRRYFCLQEPSVLSSVLLSSNQPPWGRLMV